MLDDYPGDDDPQHIEYVTQGPDGLIYGTDITETAERISREPSIPREVIREGDVIELISANPDNPDQSAATRLEIVGRQAGRVTPQTYFEEPPVELHVRISGDNLPEGTVPGQIVKLIGTAAGGMMIRHDLTVGAPFVVQGTQGSGQENDDNKHYSFESESPYPIKDFRLLRPQKAGNGEVREVHPNEWSVERYESPLKAERERVIGIVDGIKSRLDANDRTHGLEGIMQSGDGQHIMVMSHNQVNGMPNDASIRIYDTEVGVLEVGIDHRTSSMQISIPAKTPSAVESGALRAETVSGRLAPYSPIFQSRVAANRTPMVTYILGDKATTDGAMYVKMDGETAEAAGLPQYSDGVRVYLPPNGLVEIDGRDYSNNLETPQVVLDRVALHQADGSFMLRVGDQSYNLPSHEDILRIAANKLDTSIGQLLADEAATYSLDWTVLDYAKADGSWNPPL